MALQNDKSLGGEDLPRGFGAEIVATGMTARIGRAVDAAAAAAGLVLFSPIFLFTVVAIKLDLPGPVFVREVKLGAKNQPIEVLNSDL